MRVRSTAWVHLAVLLATSSAAARTVSVTDATSLQAAIGAAQAGDEILLADGTYALGNVNCSAAGTSSQPIVVRGQSPLGAVIEFSGLEGFKVSGPHWHFEDLDIVGTCAQDPDCEHAFHVFGAAEGFVMRGNRVRDFNAQLKVNASQVNGTWTIPHGGRVEFNELADTRARATSSPVTKLNIDTGDDWVVRGNIIRDFHKDGGNFISYGAFMKSGGNRGVFEGNLVLCTRDVATGGTRIGLSFGGGGTAPQFCAPAFDASTPCNVEHRDGVMRNNIIANCSDVGIYINRGTNTLLAHNTLLGTSGIDFRFDTSTGNATNNLLAGSIRMREGGTFSGSGNSTGVAQSAFDAVYQDPLKGDLRTRSDATVLAVSAARLGSVATDYCARPRGTTMVNIGALEHSLGDCGTLVPVRGSVTDAGPAPDAAASLDAGSIADASRSSDAGVPAVVDAGGAPDASAVTSDAGHAHAIDDPTGAAPPPLSNCSCSSPMRDDGWLSAGLALLAATVARRRRTERDGGVG